MGWRKNALYVITPDGDLIGKLATGHNFYQAAISPDHKWLAYDETNDQAFLLNLSTREVTRLDNGCKSPSWAPDGQTLIVACRTVLLSYEFIDGKWTKTGTLLPPVDFSQYPPEAIDTMRLRSPVWSPDSKKIAYFVTLEALTTNTGFGPYISTKSCLQEDIDCETYNLSINNIHYQGKLSWLQDPMQLAIYLSIDDEVDVYVYSTNEIDTRIKRYHLTEDEFIESFAFSSDNQYIAFRPYTGSVYLFNTNTEEKIKIYNGLNWEQLEVLFWLKILGE